MQYVLNRKDSWYMTIDERKKIEDFIDGLFKDNPSIPISQQRRNIEEFIMLVIDKIGSIENDYSKNVYDLNGRITDIEHLIEFSTVVENEGVSMDDFVDQSNIPQDLQGLASDEYLKRLSETLQVRRRKKDMHAIMRVCRENLMTVRNFVTNMGNRVYTLRSGDDVSDDDIDEKAMRDISPAVTVKPSSRYQPRRYSDGNNDGQPKVSLSYGNSSNKLRYNATENKNKSQERK